MRKSVKASEKKKHLYRKWLNYKQNLKINYDFHFKKMNFLSVDYLLQLYLSIIVWQKYIDSFNLFYHSLCIFILLYIRRLATRLCTSNYFRRQSISYITFFFFLNFKYEIFHKMCHFPWAITFSCFLFFSVWNKY